MRAHIATILIAAMLVGAPAWAQSVESIDSAVAAFEGADFQGCLEILDRMERRLGKSPRKESLRVLALREAGRYRDAYASLLTYLQLTAGYDLSGNQAHADLLELRNWLRVQLNAEREQRVLELQNKRDEQVSIVEREVLQRQNARQLQTIAEAANRIAQISVGGAGAEFETGLRAMLTPEQFAHYRRTAAPHPIIEIDTQFGRITLRLDRQRAPIAVEHFIDFAADKGRFGNFMASRHQPWIVANSHLNWTGENPHDLRGLPSERGTIGMFRRNAIAFFIGHANYQELDRGGYTVFGRVTEGMDVVERISRESGYVRIHNVRLK